MELSALCLLVITLFTIFESGARRGGDVEAVPNDAQDSDSEIGCSCDVCCALLRAVERSFGFALSVLFCSLRWPERGLNVRGPAHCFSLFSVYCSVLTYQLLFLSFAVFCFL